MCWVLGVKLCKCDVTWGGPNTKKTRDAWISQVQAVTINTNAKEICVLAPMIRVWGERADDDLHRQQHTKMCV